MSEAEQPPPKAGEISGSVLDSGMTEEEAEAWRVKQEEKRKAREEGYNSLAT